MCVCVCIYMYIYIYIHKLSQAVTDSKRTEVSLPTGVSPEGIWDQSFPPYWSPLSFTFLVSSLSCQKPLCGLTSPLLPSLELLCAAPPPSLTILFYRTSPHCQSLLGHIYNCVPQNFSRIKRLKSVTPVSFTLPFLSLSYPPCICFSS